MKDNTFVLIIGEIGLAFLSGVALLVGQTELAGVGIGAFAGLIAGHLNGTVSGAQSGPQA